MGAREVRTARCVPRASRAADRVHVRRAAAPSRRATGGEARRPGADAAARACGAAARALHQRRRNEARAAGGLHVRGVPSRRPRAARGRARQPRGRVPRRAGVVGAPGGLAGADRRERLRQDAPRGGRSRDGGSSRATRSPSRRCRICSTSCARPSSPARRSSTASCSGGCAMSTCSCSTTSARSSRARGRRRSSTSCSTTVTSRGCRRW